MPNLTHAKNCDNNLALAAALASQSLKQIGPQQFENKEHSAVLSQQNFCQLFERSGLTLIVALEVPICDKFCSAFKDILGSTILHSIC